ncbi:hypothetical protein FLONG3_8651 [Fusarium longipes]|uniref:Uncharacterized protein n=1 Tax=Fusarium longipes TaxID=694270 RepID=A0A395S3L2_9HYPO|nr:hypothetical protein FLONG3_8651 [Fusarium longipes]
MASTTGNLRTSTSNIKREEECPSTLRARLRDEPLAEKSPIEPIPYRNVYQEVHASLRGPEQDETLVQELENAYARMGYALHSSATKHLLEAHAEVKAKTKAFSEESSKTLEQNKALYDNITHPLSATLCHSEDYPQASIATHLKRLKQDIAAAREDIVRLGTEWEECCKEEEAAWNEFKKGFEDNGQGTNVIDKEAKTAAEELKKEVRAIVEAKCQMLDEIDQDFKQRIQEETQKIMATLLAGI